jgi:hypothetical protein
MKIAGAMMMNKLLLCTLSAIMFSILCLESPPAPQTPKGTNGIDRPKRD